MRGIRSGAISFLWALCVLGLAILVAFLGLRAGGQSATEELAPIVGPLTLGQLGAAFDALVVYALVAPFLGAFLAVTRQGIWNADLVFRRSNTLAFFGLSFFVLWQFLSMALESLTPSGGGTLVSAMASGGIVALLRKPLESTTERILFPKRSEIQAAADELVMMHRATEGSVNLQEHLTALRAEGVAAVRMQADQNAVARGVGRLTAPVATTVLVAESGNAEETIVEYELSTHFAFPLLSGGAEPARDVAGWVVVEPLRGSRLYTQQERRALSFAFRFLGERLLPERGVHNHC